MYNNLRIVPHNETTVHLTGPCVACTKPVTVEYVNKEELQRYHAGELAQRLFSMMNVDDREFIISGVCKSCFAEMFQDEELIENEMYDGFDPPYTVKDDIYEYNDEDEGDDFEDLP